MYQFSYAEVLDDMPQAARNIERQAIYHCIDLLQAAEEAGEHSPQAVEALLFTARLWTIFLEDLSKPDNTLPESLKADTISIGIFSLKEVDRIRQGDSKNFRILIDVFKAIAEGLQ